MIFYFRIKLAKQKQTEYFLNIAEMQLKHKSYDKDFKKNLKVLQKF